MKKIFFSASVWLRARPHVVCLWHENPANISTISPPWLKVHSIQASPRAVAGEEFALHLSQLGIPLRWRGRWARVDVPCCLEDIALESPFADWRHTHLFELENEGTRMTDRVECTLPATWGWLPGAAWLVKLFLLLMFVSRHRATRHYFSSKMNNLSHS